MSVSVKKSGAPCGPYRTFSVQSCVSSTAGGTAFASAAPPIRSTSPVRNSPVAWPPKPPSANVAREPMNTGASSPPDTAKVARKPGPAARPMAST